MRALARRALALVVCVLVLVAMPGTLDAARPARHGAHQQPYRHYLGGMTRTTQYTWTGARTATGYWPYYGEVAVDPRVIPLYALVHIPGLGVFRALDTGGAVWGNHVDVYVNYFPNRAVREYYAGVYWTYS